eukprot:1158619-Pelagomonas_calceolata.AAC.3
MQPQVCPITHSLAWGSTRLQSGKCMQGTWRCLRTSRSAHGGALLSPCPDEHTGTSAKHSHICGCLRRAVSCRAGWQHLAQEVQQPVLCAAVLCAAV